MSRVFVSAGTGAAVYVFANDHCPPHVHVKHRAEAWMARVEFSYVNTPVKLLSIAPTKNIPAQRVINRLLDEVQERLSSCRQHWWIALQTNCLINQRSLVTTAGTILLSKPVQGAKQIAVANHDPAAEQLHVSFVDGSKLEVRTRP